MPYLNRLQRVSLSLQSCQSVHPAFVPPTAIFKPPQAFVDAIQSLLLFRGQNRIDCSDKGITDIDFSEAGPFALHFRMADQAGVAEWDLSANALSEETINGLLLLWDSHKGDYESQTKYIHLDRGTNAAPTGDGLSALANLRTGGWSIDVNQSSNVINPPTEE